MTANVTFSPAVQKAFARPSGTHVSLGQPLRGILFVAPMLILCGFIFGIPPSADPVRIGLAVCLAILIGMFVSGIRVAAQWEHGVVLRLGRFHSVRGPGVFYVTPFLEHIEFVDLRTLTLNIPRQKVITKDNVPAEIDGVLFFRVEDAKKSIVSVQDYRFAIAQYAQASLRDVVGGLSLDEVLSEREQIQGQIEGMVEQHVKDWGVHVESIRLLDIEMPQDLKQMMSRQASAEREKRATITKAEGDKLAAINLAEAAATMLKSPGAMQLRSLQTLDGLGSNPSNTVVLFPLDLTEAVGRLGHGLARTKEGQ